MAALPFCDTSVFRRIERAISLSVAHDDNGAIIGAAGVGKAMALKQYVARNPNAFHIELTELSGRSPRAIYGFICDQLGIERGRANYETERKLLRWLPSDTVLLIDEAQHMPGNVVEAVVKWRGRGGPLVMLCGNERTLRPNGQDAATFAQVTTRVGWREVIDCILSEDADAITNTFGVEGIDTYRLARAVAAKHHARGLVRVLKLARHLASDATIKLTHLRQAVEQFPDYRPLIKAAGV